MHPRPLLPLPLLCVLLVGCGADEESPDPLDASAVVVADSAVARDAEPEAGAAPGGDASSDAAAELDASVAAVDAALEASVDASTDAGALDAAADAQTGGAAPFERVYRIALRVHRADSGLSAQQLAAALDEMNQIWWRQAAICFEIDVSDGQQPRTDGFDLWFHRSTLGCGATGNGVYCGDHDIHTLDAPSLGAADDAQWDSRLNPARTSAHELGHGLRLDHYNGFADSNDSLMSSGRQGFKLHAAEVSTARARAAQKALPDSSPAPCAPAPR